MTASHHDIGRIIKRFDSDTRFVISKVYGDGGTDPLFPRLERAAGNQADGGDATVGRYAIWANTVRDNIRHAIELIEAGETDAAKPFLYRAANSLSAFSEIQALFERHI